MNKSPELVVTKDFSGYYLEEIMEYLGEHRYAAFNKWFRGQTGAIHDGKMLVYQWDFDRFMKGLPAYD